LFKVREGHPPQAENPAQTLGKMGRFAKVSKNLEEEHETIF
jgi:hypothetical protein